MEKNKVAIGKMESMSKGEKVKVRKWKRWMTEKCGKCENGKDG